MKKRISFITLGCKLNYAETSTYERQLLKEGFEAVPWSKGADVFVVNTCTVTEHSDKKSRNIIRKLHRQNPDAQIYVTGCSAQLRRADYEAIDGVRRVFGATEKSMVVPTILSNVCEASCCGHDLGTFFPAYSSGERTRSFLKVQDGCDYKCHYCTVPYARGESRNIPIAEIIPQAEAIAAEGICDRRDLLRSDPSAERRGRHRKIQDFIYRAEPPDRGNDRLDYVRNQIPPPLPYPSTVWMRYDS